MDVDRNPGLTDNSLKKQTHQASKKNRNFCTKFLLNLTFNSTLLHHFYLKIYETIYSYIIHIFIIYKILCLLCITNEAVSHNLHVVILHNGTVFTVNYVSQ